MIARLLILLLFGLVPALATAGDTYRWEDEQGRVYYSDLPPPPGARNVRRTREYDEEAEQELPYRLRVVVEKSPVTLYVTDCGEPCDRARELLVARGVPHTMLDPTDGKAQQQLLALTGGSLEVPVIEVGATVLRGFEGSQWNSALDVAGYPSYAMIEVKPYVPQPAEQPATPGGVSGDVATGDADELDAEQAEIDPDEDFVENVETDELAGEDAEPAEIEQDE